MTAARILIVESQRSLRRTMRGWLEKLGYSLEILEVSSGEEALLVLARHAVDLLISDVRLVGISGLELAEKARTRRPGLKALLMAGEGDQATRQGPAALSKPLDEAAFCRAVQALLELPELPPAEESAPIQAALTPRGRLEALHSEIGAAYTALLGDDAHPLEQCGNLPGAFAGMAMMSALLSAFKSSRQMASLVGGTAPGQLFWFAGARYELYVALLGQSAQAQALLAVCPLSGSPRPRAALAFTQAAADISTALTQHAEPPQPPVELPVAAARVEAQPEAPPADQEIPPAPDLEALFDRAEALKSATGDLDAFWDALSEDASRANFAGGKAVDFEQARRMGMNLEEGN
jgi:CheY-like chemotaxis protein